MLSMSKVMIIITTTLRTCEASLVPPKQSVLSILVRCSHATITHGNIIETRPKAAWGAATLDLTKQKLLWQSSIGVLNI